MKTDKLCPKCGASVETEMEFCGECGADLQIECPSCKNRYHSHFSFCPKCGVNNLNSMRDRTDLSSINIDVIQRTSSTQQRSWLSRNWWKLFLPIALAAIVIAGVSIFHEKSMTGKWYNGNECFEILQFDPECLIRVTLADGETIHFREIPHHGRGTTDDNSADFYILEGTMYQYSELCIGLYIEKNDKSYITIVLLDYENPGEITDQFVCRRR